MKGGGKAGDRRKRGEVSEKGELVPEMKGYSLRCQVVNRGGQTRLTFVKYNTWGHRELILNNA